MELSDIKKIKNLKLISSTESNCYIYKDVVYKIFKNALIVRDRLDTIKFFLENDIHNCPTLYDFIYDNNEIIGYSMQYYKKAIPVSEIKKFKLLKEKCFDLINVYLSLKNDTNFCFIDFNKGNVFINKDEILLLDIDGCIKTDSYSEKVSEQLLKEFILGLIYKTYFFESQPYFMAVEREQIRSVLFEGIESINDLQKFTKDVTEMDVKKVLKRIPYKIK